MERRIWIPLIFMFVLSACAGGGFQEPLASVKVETQTTYSPPQPTQRQLQETNVVLISGVSEISNLQLKIDGPSARASLQGTVTIRPVNHNGIPVVVPLDLDGIIQADNMTAYLRPLNTANLEGLQARAGAALVCLTKDCATSFVDIYVEHKGHMYHHQVESKAEEKVQNSQPKNEKEKTKELKPRRPKPKANSGGHNRDIPTPPVKEPDDSAASSEKQEEAEEPAAPEEDTKTESEEAAPEASARPDEEDELVEREPEIEMTTYVGEPEKDIQILFPDLKPKDKKTEPEKAPAPSKPVPPMKDKTKKESKDEKNKKDPKDEPKTRPEEPAKKDKTPEVPEFPAKETAVVLQQAIDAPTSGKLAFGTDFLSYQKANPQAGFVFIYPDTNPNYYGTNDLLAIIARMGQFSVKNFDGYVLRLNTISKKAGGPIYNKKKELAHQSHQNGLDADIEYYFKTEKPFPRMGIAVEGNGVVSKKWMAEEQWELFKFIVATQNVDRIGVDTEIKRELCSIAREKRELIDGKTTDKVVFETLRALSEWPGHRNHYHLRIKCSSTQKRCRQALPPPMATDCPPPKK